MSLVPNSRFYLSASLPPDLSRAVDLMSFDPDPAGPQRFIEYGGISIPPIDPSKATRDITLELYLRGIDGTDLERKRREIEQLLLLANEAVGDPAGFWTGDPITLWAKELGSPNYVYFDVVRGSKLTAKVRESGPNPVQRWTLTLVVLNEALGDPIVYPWSRIFSNGPAAQIALSNVPGDRPALVQWEIEDWSDSGALNGIYLGGRGSKYLDPAKDVSSWLGVIPSGAGLYVTDTTAIDGSGAAQITSSPNWQEIGRAPGGFGLYDAEAGDVWVRVKSSLAQLDAPDGLTAMITAGGSGTLGLRTYYFAVAALDASGHETAITAPVVVDMTTMTGSVVLSWTDHGPVSDHRIYDVAGNSHINTGSAGSTYTVLNETSWTTSAPLTTNSPYLSPPQVRARVGLYGSAPVWSNPGDPVPFNYGAEWEWLYVGRFPLPPMRRQEGASTQPYLIMLEGQSTGPGTPTISFDQVQIMPATNAQQYVLHPGLTNTARFRYVLDTRRDGGVSCHVTPLSDLLNQSGDFETTGQFGLWSNSGLTTFARATDMLNATTGSRGAARLATTASGTSQVAQSQLVPALPLYSYELSLAAKKVVATAGTGGVDGTVYVRCYDAAGALLGSCVTTIQLPTGLFDWTSYVATVTTLANTAQVRVAVTTDGAASGAAWELRIDSVALRDTSSPPMAAGDVLGGQGSFETGLSSWAAVGTATVTQDTAHVLDGTHALKLALAATGDGARRARPLVLDTQHLPTYQVHCPIYPSVGTLTVTLTLTDGISPVSRTIVNPAANAWTDVTIAFTPTSIGPWTMSVTFTGGAVFPANVWVDRLSVSTARPVATNLLQPRQRFYLAPGGNVCPIRLVGAAGSADAQSLRARARATVRPRYVDVIGIVS